MNYLGKKKVYEYAVSMLKYQDMPKIGECRYKKYSGYEWLEFDNGEHYVKFTVKNGGEWYRVVERNCELRVVRDEVLKSQDPRLLWKTS